MKRPLGERDGPTEPFESDADVDDGPTVRVFIPDEGPAQILGMGLPDFAGELSPDAKTLEQRARREVTDSNFYTAPTRESKRDPFEDAKTLERRPQGADPLDYAKTLERRPRGSLPSFEDTGRVTSTDAWTLPRPALPPLPTQPIPLVPPRSSPFPLFDAVEKSARVDRMHLRDSVVEVSAALAPVDSPPQGAWSEAQAPAVAPYFPTPSSRPSRAIPETFPTATATEPAQHGAPRVELGLAAPRGFVPKGSIPPPGAPRPPHPTLSPSPLSVGKDRTLIAAAVGVFAALSLGGLGAAGLFLLLRKPAAKPQPQPRPPAAASVAAEAPATTPSTAPQCSMGLAPRLLLADVLTDVRPEVATAPGQGQVAVGVAANRYEARGLIVNVTQLSTEVRMSERLTHPVFRVTPLPGRSPATFVVDTDDARIGLLRTVPSTPPFRLGTTAAGIVRVTNGASSLIWPGSTAELGEPSFASVAGVGTAVAFQRGKQSGETFVGWLTREGARASELVRVEVGGRPSGRPVLVGDDRQIVVAVAAAGNGEPERIFAAAARPGEIPRNANPVALTDGNSGQPSLIAFDRGYILSWLTGNAETLRLQARALDAQLQPQGPVFELSSQGVADAPGALVARQDQVLAVHFRVRDGRSELWGSTLVCR
ncbi:MAG: hypothetical protein R3B13_12055 [Polyangiaceae bacterium]